MYVVLMSAYKVVICYHPYRGNPYRRGPFTVVFHYCDAVGVGVNEVVLSRHSYGGTLVNVGP